jgi:putative chitinase
MALNPFSPPLGQAGIAPGWTQAPSLDDVLFGGRYLTQGHQGPAVAEVQKLLGITADGFFGAITRSAVEDFQRSVQLSPTSGMSGTVGKTTLRTLIDVKRQWLAAPSMSEVIAGSRLLWQGQSGPAVQELQGLLQLPVNMRDGFFGAATHGAVIQVQRAAHLRVPPGMEGVVGREVLQALQRTQAQVGRLLTLEELRAIMPQLPLPRAQEFLEPLHRAMAERSITTERRQAAFLAQLAHESGEFRFMEELSDGQAYEGRQSLGNTQPGDGPRFKGRGPIQLTGRTNYTNASRALGVDLVANPTLAATPEVGCRVAAWFWQSHGLNELADVGDFRRITFIINGGYTHLERREAYYHRALQVLGRVTTPCG